MRSSLRKAVTIGRLSQRNYSSPTRYVLSKNGEPVSTWQRRVGAVAYYSVSFYCFYQIYALINARVFSRGPGGRSEDQERKRKLDNLSARASEVDEDEYEDITFNIPLTWPKRLPDDYYSGASQEWQDFRDLNQDRERCEKIKLDVARAGLDSHRRTRTGAAVIHRDSRITGLGLNIQFPTQAPPSFLRKSLEVSSDSVRLVSEEVNTGANNRLWNIFWPVPTVKALWETNLALWHALKYLRDQQSNKATMPASHDGYLSSTTGHAPTSKSVTPSASTSDMRVQTSNANESEASNQPNVLASLLAFKIPIILPNAEFAGFMSQWFFQTLIELRGATQTIPRGVCYVSGEIGFTGPRYYGKFAVFATVVPSSGKIVSIKTLPLFSETVVLRPRR